MIKTKQQYLTAQRLIRNELSHSICCIIHWRTKIQKDRFMCREDRISAFKYLDQVRLRFKEELFELCRFNDQWLDKKTIGYFISNIDFERYHKEIESIYRSKCFASIYKF